jgi:hypothetical protein
MKELAVFIKDKDAIMDWNAKYNEAKGAIVSEDNRRKSDSTSIGSSP